VNKLLRNVIFMKHFSGDQRYVLGCLKFFLFSYQGKMQVRESLFLLRFNSK
jgi:hypothetical protein